MEELIHAEGFITSDALSKTTGASSRTIRKDMNRLRAALEDAGITVIAVPSKGYRIKAGDHKKALAVLKSKQKAAPDIPTLPIDRKKHIIQKLLFEQARLKAEHLVKELYISPSTVERDLQEVSGWMQNQGLKLTSHKGGVIIIEGKEPLIRIAMVNYLTGFDDTLAFPRRKDLRETIGDKFVKPVTNLLYENYKSTVTPFSDAEFINLVAYLAVSLFDSRKTTKSPNQKLHSMRLSARKKQLSLKISHQN